MGLRNYTDFKSNCALPSRKKKMFRISHRKAVLSLGALIAICITIGSHYVIGPISHSKASSRYRYLNEKEYAFISPGSIGAGNSANADIKMAETMPHLRHVFNMSEDVGFHIGSENLTFEDKYFIYRCDESTLSFCGGWIDRIKGTTAAYVIANLTGRTFKMEVLQKSCDFHRYLVPNHVNWHLPVSFHEKVKAGPGIAILQKMDDRKFINSVDFNFAEIPQMSSKFVYYKGNREYFTKFQNLRKYREALAWMKNLTYGDIVNALYRHLFKPSPYLITKTKSFLGKNVLPHEKLVCTHMRTGPNPTIPNDVFMYQISESGIRNTFRFLEEMTNDNTSKIFFMSDSGGLIGQVKQLPFSGKVFFSDGIIVHIDRSRGLSPEEKCEGLEKIIFEHYVLLHCNVLLISKSGIGVHAAFVRNTDEGLYCLHDSGDLAPCKRKDIVDIYRLKL